MSDEHSVVAPSSAARRFQCSASTTLERDHGLPESDDPAAPEGVAAHWGVAEQLSGRLVDEGEIAPNGVVLTDEMAQAADQVLDYVTKLLAPFGLRPEQGHIEERVKISRVHDQSFGTPDYWIWLPGWILFILDFKFGHRRVEAFENRQLVEYLAGVSEGRPRDVPDIAVNVIAVIAQPRAHHRDGPIREWRTTLADMRGLINQQSNAAHEALGPNPRARVGEECRDCRARHVCPALQGAAYAAMDEAQRATPMPLPAAAASLELRLVRRALERLEARQSGLEEQISGELKRGTRVPGWRVEHGAGRERWKRPAAEVIAVGSMMGLNLAKVPEPVTPKQAREKGLDPAIVAEFSERPAGSASLVEDAGDAARRVFG
jgi:hypothetical protein